MQRLIVRLGSKSYQPIHWLVYSEQENEIIASGRLNDASELPSLKERASSAQVIAMAPASELHFKHVTLPENANRKTLAALPYMIEEELCGDVDELFFALGDKKDNIQELAVVNKQAMHDWQNTLQQAELFCPTLVADAHCLPYTDKVSVLQLDNQLLVKLPSGECMQGETEWLLPLVFNKCSHEQLGFMCYSEIDGLNNVSDVEVSYDFDLLPMQLLMQGAIDNNLNLFQSEFAVKRKSNPTWDRWRLVASLAIIALCVNLVMKTTELSQLKTKRDELKQEISATVKRGFPNLGRVNKVRIIVQREMEKLEQGGGNVSMLAMLSRLESAFKDSGVKPQTIRYDSKRSEIRIQSVAKSFEALEKFSREAQTLGFEVDQGALNNRGDEVVGVITIRA